jgi:hypothetical protein
MKKILLVGTPRSGTTLLQQLISNRKDVYTTEETHFISLLNPVTFGGGAIPKFLLYPRAIRRLTSLVGSGLGHEHLMFQYQSMISEFARIMDAAAKARECIAWVEKTPRHLSFVDDALRAIQDLNVICVIRGPVATVNSLFKATNNYPDQWSSKKVKYTLDVCTERWADDVKRTHRLLAAGKIQVVRYEDVVSHSEGVRNYLYDLLGLSVHGELRTGVLRDVISPSEVWKSNNHKEVFSASRTYDNDEKIFDMIDASVMAIYDEIVRNVSYKSI